MAKPGEEVVALESLNKLKSTDPPLFLSPNSDLSLSCRKTSEFLFNSLKPHSPKSPFDQLLTEGFDAEQIWQQIDLLSLPLISSLKRDVKHFEKNPDQISRFLGKSKVSGGFEREVKVDGNVGLEEDSEEFEGLSDEEEDEDEERENGMGEGRESMDDEEEGGDLDDENGGGEDDNSDGMPEVEDDFLKIKDLEKYLVTEEEREYGSEDKRNSNKKDLKSSRKGANKDEDEDEDEDGDEEDESEAGDEEDELLMYGEGDEDDDELGDNSRYDDFFVSEKKKPKRKWKQAEESDESKMNVDNDERKNENLSTHEKELLKIQAKIKEMEEANLEPKEWTMQGEVTASKRPKDSALEVDLDFDHNNRPPPVITEEVTASLEEIIKHRLAEGKFDDVQRAPKLPSAAPKETKELDDNKSKRGLAEIYEEEYAQHTGLASAPMSFNDELKKEADALFKRLCLKLDALSHFHFAPKPVVEDMSVQANISALAMEEIAPMAVSDAAMLAPEEVFTGKGDIKEETELTKEDRKRRRARKKRKVKKEEKTINAKRTVNPATEKPLQIHSEGKEL